MNEPAARGGEPLRVAYLVNRYPLLSHSFRCEIPEGDLAVPLGQVAAAFPDVSMGSYPFGGVGAILVLRHQDRARLAEAADALRAALVPLGGAQSETPP